MDNKIIETLTRIETKLDAVIKALHEYDGNDEYGESSFETFMETWEEEELNKRMDIIGQNGNEGSHYVTNEEADEDANSTQDKHVGGKKGKRKFNGNKKNSTNSGR
jgi:hypothetical protein